MRRSESNLWRVINAKLRHGTSSAGTREPSRFSAGEWQDRTGHQNNDQRYNFSGAPLRLLPAPRAGFAAGVVRVWLREPRGRAGLAGDAARADGSRQALARRCTWAGPAADWTLGVTPLYRETRLAAAGPRVPPLWLCTRSRLPVL